MTIFAHAIDAQRRLEAAQHAASEREQKSAQDAGAGDGDIESASLALEFIQRELGISQTRHN